MAPARLSPCGRFAVVDALHLDRDVFDAMAHWAADHHLGIQDALQLALCAFIECVSEGSKLAAAAASTSSETTRFEPNATGVQTDNHRP